MKSKEAQGKCGEPFILAFVSSFLLSTKLCPRFFLICFARYIKSFYQSSLENEVGFRDIMNVFLNILAKSFVDERALLTTTLISSCHWKTLVPFCLQKKRPENAFLTLTVTYHILYRKTNYVIHNKGLIRVYYILNELWFKRYIQKCTLFHVLILIIMGWLKIQNFNILRTEHDLSMK